MADALRPECPEDCVVYTVYTQGPRDELERTAREATRWLTTLFPFLRDYIWQRDPFELRACLDAPGPPQLMGETRFGDNVADEWFIVFLLLELSRGFPNLIISVSDDDGQFLLIEAAPDLPDWLEPETSDNRVFLHRGELHIVPRDAPFPSGPLALAQALELIGRHGSSLRTLAPSRVRARIAQRLACFPQSALLSNYHRCRVMLPLPLARALSVRPQLVARAVAAFYYREQTDMRHLRVMKHYDPAAHVSVVARVRFTRCLFAQLLHQTFHAPNKGFAVLPDTDPLSKAVALGMKLCCGFELWCAADPQAAFEVAAACAALEASVERFAGDRDTVDDDEGWMLVTPEEVNDLLAAKESDVHAQLNESVAAVSQFVGHESAFEGAEVPFLADDSGAVVDGDGDGDGDAGVFDVERFVNALKRGLGEALDIDAGEDDDDDDSDCNDDDEPSEWMDRELTAHGLDGDFERGGDGTGAVDADLTLVTNILRGMEAAQGAPGPMTNLLSQLLQQQPH